MTYNVFGGTLSLTQSVITSQMTLRPRGHSYDVRRVVYDLTKRSFILRSLYKEKSALLSFFIFVVHC